MSDQKSNLCEIFALWKNTSKNGDTYLSGTMGNSKILVLKNTRKEADNQPDYRVFVAPKDNSNSGND
jgi:uncharacterized protein (DUF736 family)